MYQPGIQINIPATLCHSTKQLVTIVTIVECVNICDTDAFKVSLMMQNKGGKQSFDPFMFSLMTEQSQVRQYSEVIVLTFDLCLTGWYLKGGGMNPMMLQMMMNNKMSDMGPLMPLFMTGKTAEDPLLMMMLMAQKADPKTTQNEGVQKLLPLLKLMSNDCDYGGEKCACNHVSVDLLMMQSLMAGMQSRGEAIDLSPFMFMMWDPVPGCMGSLPNGDECICGTGGYF